MTRHLSGQGVTHEMLVAFSEKNTGSMKGGAYADVSIETADCVLKHVCARSHFLAFNTHLELPLLNQLGWSEVTREVATHIEGVIARESMWLSSEGAPAAFTTDYATTLRHAAKDVLEGRSLGEQLYFAQSANLYREMRDKGGKREMINLIFSFSSKPVGVFPDRPLFHSLPGRTYYGQFQCKKWPTLPQCVQVHTLAAWLKVKMSAREQGKTFSKDEVNPREKNMGSIKCFGLS